MRLSTTLTPQAILVRDYLLTGKSLTQMIALNSLGVGSITKRIAELRAAGYEIITERKKDHFKKNYADYRMVSPLVPAKETTE